MLQAPRIREHMMCGQDHGFDVSIKTRIPAVEDWREDRVQISVCLPIQRRGFKAICHDHVPHALTLHLTPSVRLNVPISFESRWQSASNPADCRAHDLNQNCQCTLILLRKKGLGHYMYRTIDQQKFADLTRSLQQGIDDDLYHEGEAMLFAWKVDEEIAKNGGPPLNFHQQGRRELLEREIAAANVVARSRIEIGPDAASSGP